MEMRPPSRIFRLSDEAFAFRAEQICCGHVAIGEDNFGRVAGAHAELIFFFAGAKTGRALFEDEGADAVGFLGFVGDGHGHADVGVVAVGGEGFRAVEDPVDRPGARRWCACRQRRSRLRVRSATRRPSFLPCGQGNEIFALLLFGAEFVDVIGAERIVRGNEKADGAIDAREFFDDGGVFDVAEAGAAVLLRENNAHQAHFGELWEEFRTGKWEASSHSMTWGAISPSANSRTVLRR